MQTLLETAGWQIDFHMKSAVHTKTHERPSPPCVFTSIDPASDPTAHQHSIQSQQNDGAENGHQPPCSLAGAVEAQRAPDEAANESAGNAQQYRDDEPSGVSAWHEQLRDDADHQAEHNPRKNSHRSSLPFFLCGTMQRSF